MECYQKTRGSWGWYEDGSSESMRNHKVYPCKPGRYLGSGKPEEILPKLFNGKAEVGSGGPWLRTILWTSVWCYNCIIYIYIYIYMFYDLLFYFYFYIMLLLLRFLLLVLLPLLFLLLALLLLLSLLLALILLLFLLLVITHRRRVLPRH